MHSYPECARIYRLHIFPVVYTVFMSQIYGFHFYDI